MKNISELLKTIIRKSPVVQSVLRVSYYPLHVKENTYTGDRLIGITLHKSNMVPVFHKQDAEDISKMRHG